MNEAGERAREPQIAGGALRLARRAARVTQRQLARSVGCTPGMVAHIEKGRRRAGPELARRLGEAIERMDRGEAL